MPDLMCACIPNSVVLGARCPQPCSSSSLLPKSCFGQHPSHYHSDTSQSFFSRPLHLWILERMKLLDSKRVNLHAVGAQKGCSCPCPFHNPSFSICLCSSSGLNSGRLILVYILTAASLKILSTKDLSAFIFFQPVSLRCLRSCPRWSWRAGSSSFLASILLIVRFMLFFFAVFLVSVHWHTR